jgi:hypothetical protein
MPPPPMNPVPVLLLAAFGVIGVVEVFISRWKVQWGIGAGLSLLSCGYLVVRSRLPVRREVSEDFD